MGVGKHMIETITEYGPMNDKPASGAVADGTLRVVPSLGLTTVRNVEKRTDGWYAVWKETREEVDE